MDMEIKWSLSKYFLSAHHVSDCLGTGASSKYEITGRLTQSLDSSSGEEDQKQVNTHMDVVPGAGGPDTGTRGMRRHTRPETGKAKRISPCAALRESFPGREKRMAGAEAVSRREYGVFQAGGSQMRTGGMRTEQEVRVHV